MNSYSHYAYGAVAEWMFDTIAGIDHLGHGFQHFKLAPQPGGKLKHASATYHSPYGLIRSAWRQRGKRMTYEATIPPNTRACVHLPTRDLSAVKLDGKPLAHHVIEIQQDGGFTLPAGNYKFTW